MTSYLGLSNVKEPGELLAELRRVTAGELLSTSLFYPKDDAANRAVIEEAGLASLLLERPALAHFDDAGWEVTLANRCQARALPTPRSELLGGVGVDGLPVAATTLTWGTIIARQAR